jgi:protein tyrosine/serine phosphatase
MNKTLRLFVFVVIACVLLLYIYYLNHRLTIHTVIPAEVYRSAQLDRDALDSAVRSKGIRSIINLRGKHLEREWYRDEIYASKSLGLSHYDISLSSEGLPRRRSVRMLASLLQTSERPVLVHCEAGIDRSGLASVIALLSKDTTALDEAAEHVSMRYLVNNSNSTGKVFYKQYRDWLLISNTQHTRETFLKWLDVEYVDSNGNLYYYIDSINGVVWKNGTKFDDGYSFTVDRKKNDMLAITGWVFDDKRLSPVSKVEVLMDSEPLGNVQYGQSRPDVENAFHDSNLVNTGWSFRESLSRFQDGCYDLALGIERLDGSRWVTPPEARVCLQ